MTINTSSVAVHVLVLFTTKKVVSRGEELGRGFRLDAS